ncbi:MAG: hypothetical protein QM598_05805 [Protaetiibacter sp.]
MSLIAFTSFAGSPGVSTAAIAAAVHWPRPVLFLEADTNNVGTILTGFFRSNLETRAGMHQVSVASSRGELTLKAMLDPAFEISIPAHDLPYVPSMPIPAIPTGHKLWVIPGYRELQIIDGVKSIWAKLPGIVSPARDTGLDVILDLGRLGRDDLRFPLVDAADQVVIVASSSMSDLNRLHKRARHTDMEERLKGNGRTKFSTLLVKATAEAVAPAEFARVTVPVLSTLSFDPDGAAVFATGKEDRKPNRNLYRRDIREAVAKLADRLRPAIERSA